MENIRRTEVDTQDEVAKVINLCIDNMNRIEAMVLDIVSKKKTKKKGDK